MIPPVLYRQPVPLDSNLHRTKRLVDQPDFSSAAAMHLAYVSVAELPIAALDFIVVFIEAAAPPPGGKSPLLPVALLGAQVDENLYLQDGQWTSRYIPAFFRRHPFANGPRRGRDDQPVVLVDTASPRLSETEGQRLFDDDGKPSEALNGWLGFLNMFDREYQQTIEFCATLQQRDLLKPMSAQMTLPDGQELSLGGFLVFDTDKYRALSQRVKAELADNGMLTVLHTHLASLGNIRYLAERKARRLGKSSATTPT
ncbi:MAG: SapC family protein [Proteobacteria bacterium]|nr:SapC family protein [Pseudomonadota bacterium]